MREPSQVYILEGGDGQRAGLTVAGGRGKRQQPYPVRSSRAGVLEFVLEGFSTNKQTNELLLGGPTRPNCLEFIWHIECERAGR
jgi:hypothetical protein